MGLIDKKVVKEVLQEFGLYGELDIATIREIVRVANELERRTGKKFIRMEMGVPGLQPPDIMINAEIDALKSGVASRYPMIDGVSELKTEASRFAKLFMNIDIPANCIVPAVGSMQSTFAAFLVAQRLDERKNKVLFIDPGFPVQKQQCDVIGIKYETFDVYDYRGEKLRDKLESYLKTGQFSSIVYSSPNNPTWIVFTDEELKIIGDLATKYDVIVFEDLAYFAMDFRKDYSKPGQPPYQPTVANYTDNYVIFFSSSKLFSFAGERIGLLMISPQLYERSFPYLKHNFKTDKFGYSLVYGALYALSAGVNHSAQVALARMLKAVNDGEYNLTKDVKEYGRRAKVLKQIFTENGFEIVYDKDIDEPIADGFYFTVNYPGLDTNTLIEELLSYGISAISLKITGSEREGIRACVSFVLPEMFDTLRERLQLFNSEHHNNKN